MALTFTLLLAAFISMAMVPWLAQLAGWAGFMDEPNARKVHERPVPRTGGIAIIVGAMAPLWIWAPMTHEIRGYIIGAVILGFFGIWDDRKSLDYRLKFLGQLLAALAVILYGGVVTQRFPFCDGLEWSLCHDGTLAPVVAVPFTILGLIGITNAINLADGLDGLAGGTTLLSIGTVGLLAHLYHHPEITMLSVAVLGALLGFLRYNTHPARVFMGDAGSQFLGFSAGVLVIIVTQRADSIVSPALPVLLLGWPIIDTLAVMAQRIYERRSPFLPDKNHIHHKLMALGLDHYEAVLIIYGVQALLVTMAYVLRFERDGLILALYAGIGLVILLGFHVATVWHWRVSYRVGGATRIGRAIAVLRRRRWLAVIPCQFVRFVVPGALLGTAFLASHVSRGLGMLAVLSLTAMIVSLFWPRLGHQSWLERLGIYLAGAFVAYLMQSTPALVETFHWYVNGVFMLVAMAVAMVLRFSSDGRFQVSPLDFLVIFVALLVPALLDVEFPGVSVGGVVLKFLVLVYAAEMLLAKGPSCHRLLRATALVTLLAVSVRGMLG